MYLNHQSPSVWLSLEAIHLSNELIETLQIQDGTGLAKSLGVNRIFYNHEAVRVWVQRELFNGLAPYGQLDELASRFYACVNPSIDYNNFIEEMPFF